VRLPVPLAFIHQVQKNRLPIYDDPRWLMVLFSDTGMRLPLPAACGLKSINI